MPLMHTYICTQLTGSAANCFKFAIYCSFMSYASFCVYASFENSFNIDFIHRFHFWFFIIFTPHMAYGSYSHIVWMGKFTIWHTNGTLWGFVWPSFFFCCHSFLLSIYALYRYSDEINFKILIYECSYWTLFVNKIGDCSMCCRWKRG